LLLTKNVSLHINYMLRHHFLLAPRFVWNFEFLEVPCNNFWPTRVSID